MVGCIAAGSASMNTWEEWIYLRAGCTKSDVALILKSDMSIYRQEGYTCVGSAPMIMWGPWMEKAIYTGMFLWRPMNTLALSILSYPLHILPARCCYWSCPRWKPKEKMTLPILKSDRPDRDLRWID